MKFGKRRKEAAVPDAPDRPVSPADSAAPPVTDSWTAPTGASPPRAEPSAPAVEEPVVEGEAVELPADEAPPPEFHQPVPLTLRRHEPAADPMPFPVAEQPVAVAGAVPTSAPLPLGDSGEAYASGHAAAPGLNWQEPMMQLADERPELVVGAAFAGGILAALILRRLGN